ncbi:Uncharacterised protein [Vibrio cholerae]|nr:Uncharacterised protein [Vibrio cholerae]
MPARSVDQTTIFAVERLPNLAPRRLAFQITD